MPAQKHKLYHRMKRIFIAYLLLIIRDNISWNAFNKKTWAKAKAFLNRHAINKEEKENLFQDAQITFWNNLQAGKIRYSGLPYMYFGGILRIKFFEYLRKGKGKMLVSLEEVDLQDEVNQYEMFHLSSARYSCFQKAMNQLSERDQAIIVKRLGYGYRHDDIAEDIHAASAQAVRVSFLRAKRKLIDNLNACLSNHN